MRVTSPGATSGGRGLAGRRWRATRSISLAKRAEPIGRSWQIKNQTSKIKD